MWYGYPVKSTSHLGNISNIGTKNVNVYSNKVLLFYIFIPIIIIIIFFLGGKEGISVDPGVHICVVANIQDTGKCVSQNEARMKIHID